MLRVSVNERWVVHRRRDTGSRGPRRWCWCAGGEETAGGVGDPSEEGDTSGAGGSGAGRARRWQMSTGWAKCAGGAKVNGPGPARGSGAGAGLEGDPSRPWQGAGPGVSRVTGELGHGPGKGYDIAVPAGNNCKGGSTTGSVGNTKDRSISGVEEEDEGPGAEMDPGWRP